MLSLIIVDDSYIELNGLVRGIDWSELNLEIVDTASDGQEALLKVLEHNPDILISDIKMPILDGIALTTELRRQGMATKVIFLSAFEDFDYARRGIELGVLDYIMKPVRIAELKEKIQHVVDICLQERQEHINREMIARQLQESLPLLRDTFMVNLLRQLHHQGGIQDQLRFLGLAFEMEAPHQAVSILVVDDGEADQRERYFQRKLIQHVIQENRRFKELGGYCVQMDESHFGLILRKQGLVEEPSGLDDMFEQIGASVRVETGTSLTFFVGREVASLGELHVSYADACNLEKYRLSLQDSTITYQQDIESLYREKSWDDLEFLKNLEEDLTRLIVDGDPNDIQEYVDSMFAGLADSRGCMRDTFIKNICTYCYICAVKVFSAMNHDIAYLFEQEQAIERIHGFQSLEQVKEWLAGIIIRIVGQIKANRTHKNTTVVERLINMVRTHYREDLNLAQLSADFGLSPNYLGILFKEYTGQGFLEYLTKVRMEKAKELLKDINLKVFEVAYEVGFQNVSYFSAKFKKQYNTTPKEYRELIASPGHDGSEV